MILYRPGRYLALDCEMVGVGGILSTRIISSLARVSIVNYYGEVILDEYVRQAQPVLDYRTHWSGIRPTDMIKCMSLVDWILSALTITLP